MFTCNNTCMMFPTILRSPYLGGTGIQMYGGGTGTILLDDVRCTGNEFQLWQCANRGIGVHNCAHTEDAGVICTAVCKLRLLFLHMSMISMIKIIIYAKISCRLNYKQHKDH